MYQKDLDISYGGFSVESWEIVGGMAVGVFEVVWRGTGVEIKLEKWWH